MGVAVRFPQADNLAEFRANLRAGRDSVRPVPAERVTATGLDPAAHYLPMGYRDEVANFDHAFFGLSRREAELVDPQHRLALMLAHEAVEDAGYAPSALRDSATATVFSLPNSDYHGLIEDKGTLSAIGNIPFSLPARIAHTLGLLGPCYGVDTGCNSSVVAVHHACRDLLGGDAEYALVGGVTLRVRPPESSALAAHAEVVSPTGRCRAFDASADGAAGGEGGVVLMLTTVERALADGAPIRAVVRGTSVLHNGTRSTTISSPSAAGQAEAITAAWRKAGLSPEHAEYVETHGSGTKLGDAVEVEGLGRVFAGRETPLPIGSVKTNIGHLDHVAGIAGLVKAMLSLEHGELYPSLHFDRPAPGVDLGAAGVTVQTATSAWPQPPGRRRLAGLNSFSIGGTNVHCVLEQAPERTGEGAAPAAEPVLVGVSARTGAVLAELCGRLSVALRDARHDLADVAFTLNQGRDHRRRRVAVLAGSTDALAMELAAQATWLRADAENDADGVTGVKRPTPPRVILLLSPDAEVPAGQRELPAELPFEGDAAAVASWQLSVATGLRRAGIDLAAVLSSGNSRYTGRYLLNTLSEEDSRALADPMPPFDPANLERAADELLGGGTAVFVELGARGLLGDHLAGYLGGREGAAVITVGAGTDALGRLLKSLYERGIELDWARLAAPDRAPRRLSLPVHPFDGKPCWVAPVVPVPAPAKAVVAVPEPVSTNTGDAEVTVSTVEPTVDTEAWLRELLAEMLLADEVSGESDYFELGGNSIIALQLVDRVAERFGVRPKLVDIYEHPEVADFAEHLERTRSAAALSGGGAKPAPGLPPIKPGAEPTVSFGQERMWFHHQLDATTTLYNLPMVGHLRGELDLAAYRGAWEDFAARHDVLLSNFVDRDGKPELVLRSELGDFFRYLDLADTESPMTAARSLVRAAADRKFDLARDPLLQVLVLRLAENDYVVHVTMHHGVNDGGSPKILRREFNEFYQARRAGRVHTFPPLPVTYRDYARWQRELLAGDALAGELDFWRETLRDVPAIALPIDFPRPESRNFEGAVHPFTVPAELADQLRALAKRESVTLFTVLLGALYVLLAEYSGQEDIVVGTPTTGRNRPELWDMVGFFNSTVALRADLTAAPTFAEVLVRVRDVVLAALEHQEIPFDRVVNVVADHRDPGRSPIFDVFFVHQELPPIQPIGDSPVDVFDEGDLLGGLPLGTAKFDLTLVTTDREGDREMVSCFEFSTDLFTEDTVVGFTETFLRLLEAVVAEPNGVRPARALLSATGNADTESAVTGWKAFLAGAPALEPPADRPRPSRPAGARGVHRCELPPGIGIGRDLPVLAGLEVLLAWYSGQDEFVLGVGVDAGIRPVRVTLADEPSFDALLARNQELIETARGLGVVPLEALSRALGGAEPGRHPVFDVSYRFGDTDTDTDTGGGTRRPDLEVSVSGTELSIGFATELFDERTVSALARDLVRLLDLMRLEPGRPVLDVAFDGIGDTAGVASEGVRG